MRRHAAKLGACPQGRANEKAFSPPDLASQSRTVRCSIRFMALVFTRRFTYEPGVCT